MSNSNLTPPVPNPGFSSLAYKEVMGVLQEFINSPDTADKELVYEYLILNSFPEGHIFHKTYKPLDIIDLNNAVFDYSKIRSSIATSIDVQNLTLFGHIFYAPEHRAIYGLKEVLPQARYSYKLNYTNNDNPITEPYFQIEDCSRGQIYMLYASLSAENKDFFNTKLENIEQAKYDKYIFNYVLKQVGQENNTFSSNFASLYNSIILEDKIISRADRENRIKTIMDVFLSNKTINTNSSFILSLMCCEKSFGSFNKSTKEIGSIAKDMVKYLDKDFTPNERGILIDFLTTKLDHVNAFYGPHSELDIICWKIALDQVSAQITSRYIIKEKDILSQAIGQEYTANKAGHELLNYKNKI